MMITMISWLTTARIRTLGGVLEVEAQLVVHQQNLTLGFICPWTDIENVESKILCQKKTQPSEPDSRKNSEVDACDSNISTETSELVFEPVVNESHVEVQPKVWSDAPIIEEYESDSDDDDENVNKQEWEYPVNTVKSAVLTMLVLLDNNSNKQTLLTSTAYESYMLAFVDGWIKREYSNARTPQQNGVAERKNRTLIEAARTMLADSFLPNTFWAEQLYCLL
ncbi:ribonuclease H-like domain-containing protein [Tanacetum coccineum]